MAVFCHFVQFLPHMNFDLSSRSMRNIDDGEENDKEIIWLFLSYSERQGTHFLEKRGTRAQIQSSGKLLCYAIGNGKSFIEILEVIPPCIHSFQMPVLAGLAPTLFISQLRAGFLRLSFNVNNLKL